MNISTDLTHSQFFFSFFFTFYLTCVCSFLGPPLSSLHDVPLQEKLLSSTWGLLNNTTKVDLEGQLDCCGLLNTTASRAQFEKDMANCTAVRWDMGFTGCMVAIVFKHIPSSGREIWLCDSVIMGPRGDMLHAPLWNELPSRG